MSVSSYIEKAGAGARAALSGAAGATASDAQRLARAEQAAQEALQRFDRHPASSPPSSAATSGDPHRRIRHDIRAASQAVLNRLELIGLAWSSWDATQREAALLDLEGATEELAGLVATLP